MCTGCDSREFIAETLEKLRYDICCYMSHNFCDCKFGYPGGHKLQVSQAGEQTGCPELRVVLALLRNMTDEEYGRILSRTP